MQNVGKDNHTHIAGDHISHIDKDTIPECRRLY